MSKPKIIVTRKWPEAVEQELLKRYDVTLNKSDIPMTTEQLQDALRNADAVLPTVTDPVTAEVLSAKPMRAKILGNFGVGFNNIDVAAAKDLGLTVTNTPGVLTDCTADIAMTLMLMVARRAAEGEQHVRKGQWTGWRPTHMLGTKLSGKTLGLIGMGRIAQAVATRAHFGFGMKIIFNNRSQLADEVIKHFDAQQCSAEEVLQNSDFVSLHCPGGEQTRHLINADTLKCMRSDAFLINTARGDVVDSEALIAALKNGTIAGAGLDVFEGEPSLNPGFIELNNVVLLPHLGSATKETRVGMGMCVVENLDMFFAGETPRDKVV